MVPTDVGSIPTNHPLGVIGMSKFEFLEWYRSLKSYFGVPTYVEVQDANWSQILVDGKWQTRVFIFGIFFDGRAWKYVETDSDKGHVSVLETFDGEAMEESAVKYAKEILTRMYLAT